MTCESEARDHARHARRRFERACRLEARRAMPKGDDLLRLYATKPAADIAAEYGVKEWWVRECIRRARAAQ